MLWLNWFQDACDCASTRSTTSGQSGTKWDSSFESIRTRSELNDSCSDLTGKFQDLGGPSKMSLQAVTRTTSCPSHMCMTQHQQLASVSRLVRLTKVSNLKSNWISNVNYFLPVFSFDKMSFVFRSANYSTSTDDSMNKYDSSEDTSVLGFQLGGSKIDLWNSKQASTFNYHLSKFLNLLFG
jgi:hypothetical protein